MAKQTNLAYDLSRYEYRPREEKPVIKAKKIVRANASMPKTIAIIISAGLLMCGVVYSKFEAAMVQNQITKATKEVELLNSENVRLHSEIESKTSLQNIEDYAEKVLGLKKLEKSQVEYVQLQTDDVVEIPNESSNIFIKIKNYFYDILEYLRG